MFTKKTIKNLLGFTAFLLLIIGFLSPVISRAAVTQTGTGCSTSPSGQTNSGSGCTTTPAANQGGLCYYQPTGIVYNCNNVPGSSTTTFTTGSCYTNNGTYDDNGNLVWVKQPDCSASVFSAGATCPPQGAGSGYSCKITGGSINVCQNGPSAYGSKGSSTPGCTTIVDKYINPITDFLAAGVGIIVVIMVVIGGIQYSTAGDNPQAIQAAKARITNAILALVVFGLMWSLLQWLVPGGIFH